MNYSNEEIQFLETVAKSDIGSGLIKILKKIELNYADIRNLKDTPSQTRIDALKIIRESLLDRLLVLSGEIDAPDNDEWR